MTSLSPSWVSQFNFHVTARHVRHDKVNSNCFDNREIIAVCIAMNVTAHSPHVTQRNDFSVMPFCCTSLHQSQKKVFMFASDQHHMLSHWFNLSFCAAVILFYLYGV